jgi:hypothetical protein
MPGPPQCGGQPVTNIRNVKSPHWRRWLGQASRCIVSATSFCEYADTNPRKAPGAVSDRASEEMRQFGSVARDHQPSCRTEFPSSRFTYLLGSQGIFSLERIFLAKQPQLRPVKMSTKHRIPWIGRLYKQRDSARAERDAAIENYRKQPVGKEILVNFLVNSIPVGVPFPDRGRELFFKQIPNSPRFLMSDAGIIHRMIQNNTYQIAIILE